MIYGDPEDLKRKREMARSSFSGRRPPRDGPPGPRRNVGRIHQARAMMGGGG